MVFIKVTKDKKKNIQEAKKMNKLTYMDKKKIKKAFDILIEHENDTKNYTPLFKKLKIKY